LGFFIFRESPENLKIFETFKSGVRKNQVGQGTAELNEMVQYWLFNHPAQQYAKMRTSFVLYTSYSEQNQANDSI